MFRNIKKILIYFIIILVFDCAYYNTFFNAIKSYNSATKALEKSKAKEVTGNIKKDFEKSIDKCWKLINEYGDSSKYADDALLLIGKSYFHMNEYLKAERYLGQFSQRYNDSELLPEAKLWLARTYIKLEKDDEAYTQFKDILSNQVKHEIAAYALFSMGELYYEREKYDLSLENLRKCIEVSEDDIIKAKAYFLLGDIYYKKGEYNNAVDSFKKIQNYETTILMEVESRLKKVESLIQLGKYERAINDLREMLRQNRFSEHFSIIETKIGDCYKLEGDIDYAAQHYGYVIDKYKKTEGSALATYQLARLMELHYADIDSAKNLYAKVRKEYSNSIYSKDSDEKAKMLDSYLKIRRNLDRDIIDMSKINAMGTSGSDSVRVVESVYYTTVVEKEDDDVFEEPDSVKLKQYDLGKYSLKSLYLPEDFEVEDLKLAEDFQLNEDFEDIYDLSLHEIIIRSNYDTTLIDNFIEIAPDTSSIDSILLEVRTVFTPSGRKIRQKHVKIRTEDEIIRSLGENRFSLAEFFLLSMQSYDSAVTAYSTFIKNSNDSLLIPKAFHALDYIYSYKLSDSLKADSIEKTILIKFPDSEYANYINKKRSKKPLKNIEKYDYYKQLYSNAEKLLFEKKYKSAIAIYNEIAENDSGSVLAEKSRYAIAWIYENKLQDIPNAFKAYTIITKEYPEGKIYNIAADKIKEPKEEPLTSTKSDTDSTLSQVITPDSLMTEEINPDSMIINKKSDMLFKPDFERDIPKIDESGSRKSKDGDLKFK